MIRRSWIGQWLESLRQGHAGLGLSGLPLGSPLSPVLSNIWLNSVDKSLRQQGLTAVRYADDMLVFANTETECLRARGALASALQPLDLRLNEQKTHVRDTRAGPVHFLGRDLGCRDTQGQARALPALEGPLSMRTAVGIAHDLVQPPQLEVRESTTAGLDGPAAAAEAPTPELPAQAEETLQPLALRTLYVVTQGASIHCEGERLVVKAERAVMRSIPARHVDLVMVFGNVAITSAAMRLAMEHDIHIALIDHRGRCLGDIVGNRSARIEVLQQQLRARGDNERRLELARAFVIGKVANQVAVVHRWARNHGRLPEAVPHLKAMRQTLEQVRHARCLDVIRGLEGFSARSHFAAMRILLGEGWRFESRQRRPAGDPINAMLNFGYTMLSRNIEALLAAHQLDPQVGYLHDARPGRPSLACDLVEEFRAPVVDTMVLALCVNDRVRPDDFVQCDNGGCRLSDVARRKYIAAFEARIGMGGREGADAGYRAAIDAQIRQLLRVLAGQEPQYKPWRVR